MEHFGVYIHWPFCLSKCPYCDFFSMPVRDFDQGAFWKRYLNEINDLPKKPITSIFLGGGTPCLMPIGMLDQILNALPHGDIEITMEANPDAIDLPMMKALRSLGINRLSMGVQALNDQDLHTLGRKHDMATALKRIDEAKTVFDNISMDLMYGRPGQTLKEWETELKRAVSLDLPHYSLYQLTIEEGTPFYRRHTESEQGREFIEMTWDAMVNAGIPAYEISNFAKEGFQSVHNLTYWRGENYAGLGPAAHGRLGLLATENPKSVEKWLAGVQHAETLTLSERDEERVITGLRTMEGIPLTLIKDPQSAIEKGWAFIKGDRFYPTREGHLMLNSLILEVL